jgi:hypothetical protein
MSEVAVLTPNHTIELPVEIAERFQPSDRFIIWTEGDMLHLKRITPSPLKVVEQAPPGEPLTLDEIDDIVHEVRRRRPEQRAE